MCTQLAVALFLVAVSTQQDLTTGRLGFAFVGVFVLSLSLSSVCRADTQYERWRWYLSGRHRG